MKKQFFYAALAIGMMSSCSSNDLPGNQAPEEQLPEEERVAIELGISSPNAKIEASTKGAGAVGSSTESENKWDGEQLHILMLDKNKEIVQENSQNIFEGLKFYAPSGDVSGQIGMYSDYQGIEHYTKEYKYYPQTGKYSFYGYYVDDLTGEKAVETVSAGAATLKVIIDGTQDILTAQTAPFTDQKTGSAYESQDIKEPDGTESTWSAIANNSFSAWSARRGVVPILNFQHKLSRLRFFVRAGEKEAAAWDNDGSTWNPRDKETVNGVQEAMGVFITSLVTDELTNEFTVDLLAEDMTTTPGTSKAPYVLKSYEGKVAQEGVGADGTGTGNFLPKPVAPKYYGKHSDTPNFAEEDETTYVGDIMFYPESGVTTIPVSLTLSQVVKKSETVTGGGAPTVEWQKLNNNDNPIKFNINVGDIQTSSGAITAFKEGEQYDITIVVYGYQEIKVYASLSAWKDGGSHEYNPSDEFEE